MVFPIKHSVEHTARVCAIIVTYNPNINVLNILLGIIREQVYHVVIIDNASSNGFVERIGVVTASSLTMICLDDNRGIGSAYNVGIIQAKALNCAYILFLDQDSIPRRDMVEKLLEAYIDLTLQGNRISAVGPNCRDSRTGYFFGFIKLRWFGFLKVQSNSIAIVPIDFLNSSGTLCSLELFDVIGVMDASLFIDRVDTEFILRARSFGYQPWGVKSAIMDHSLGELSKRIWLFGWKNIPMHVPFRYYYIYRNSLLLYKRPYVSIKWITADALCLLKNLFFLIVVGPDRKHYLGMMFRGIVDGP